MAAKEAFKKPVVIFLVVLGCVLLLMLLVLVGVFVRLRHKWPFPGHGQRASSNATVVVVSIDGFRYDMLYRGRTPNILQLALGGNGTVAALRPQWPAQTFPNHYTLVSGRRPAAHGIVANRFWDGGDGTAFDSSNATSYADQKWWLSPAIWTQVSSAVVLWPGSDVAIRGRSPHAWMPYDSKLTSQERIDRLLRYIDDATHDQSSTTTTTTLSHGNNRTRLFMAYLSQLDDAEHEYGPESPEADRALQAVDLAVGTLLKGLQALKLLNATDLFVVSDHGSTSVPRESLLHLHDLLPGYRQHLTWWDCGAVTQVVPEQRDRAAVLNRLRHLARTMPIEVYERHRLPRRYLGHRMPKARVRDRLASVYILARPGHSLRCAPFSSNSNSTTENDDFADDDERKSVGVHGYGVWEEPDMMAILVASGPHIRPLQSPMSGENSPEQLLKRTHVYDNVDVYPMLAQLLGVPVHKHDGSQRLANDTLLIT
jgi:hypothetical protein